MAIIDDFKARFPEFGDTVVDAKFPLIESEWPCYYGGTYGESSCDDVTILMLCAHLMSLDVTAGTQGGKGSSSRSTASKSVGSVSVSYDAATQSGGAMFDFFRTTSYGQRFLRLASRNAPAGLFV